MVKASAICLEGLEEMLIFQTGEKRYIAISTFSTARETSEKKKKKKKKVDPARIRTWNPLIRSQMPYPLGHRARHCCMAA